MRHILVVVDMQPKFSASLDALPGVIRAINQAKQEVVNPIILVEYNRTGSRDVDHRTYPAIHKTIGTWPKLRTVKWVNDGYLAIVRAYGSVAGVKVDLCGVNGCACVRETAQSLAQSGAQVRVLTDACACTRGGPNWVLKFAALWRSEVAVPLPDFTTTRSNREEKSPT